MRSLEIDTVRRRSSRELSQSELGKKWWWRLRATETHQGTLDVSFTTSVYGRRVLEHWASGEQGEVGLGRSNGLASHHW